MVSVDVKQYWTMLMHWSQLVPNNVSWHPRTLRNTTAYEGLQGWGTDSLWWQSVPAVQDSDGEKNADAGWCNISAFSACICALLLSPQPFSTDRCWRWEGRHAYILTGLNHVSVTWRLHVILNEWLTSQSAFLNIHTSCVRTVLLGCYMAGATCNCCHLGAHSAYIIQPCTSLKRHVMQHHACTVPVCLAVTCHPHFWQNDRGLLRATGVEWIPKWVSTESWPWRIKFSRHPCMASNSRPFDHEFGALTTEISLLPDWFLVGNLGPCTWARPQAGSHESSATHCYQCVQSFPVSK